MIRIVVSVYHFWTALALLSPGAAQGQFASDSMAQLAVGAVLEEELEAAAAGSFSVVLLRRHLSTVTGAIQPHGLIGGQHDIPPTGSPSAPTTIMLRDSVSRT